MRNFTIRSSLCGWEGWFWYDLFGNPEDRFCRIDAHLYSCKCGPNPQTWFMWYAHSRCLDSLDSLDYSWLIPSIVNAEGIRTKNNTPSPSAPLNTPFDWGKGGGIKRTCSYKCGSNQSIGKLKVLSETVLLSTKTNIKMMGNKVLTILR